MFKNTVIVILAGITFIETMYIKEVQGYMKAVKTIYESMKDKESD